MIPDVVPMEGDDDHESSLAGNSSDLVVPPQQTQLNASEELLIRQQREREGRCAECGIQTHEVRADVKIPLSIEHEVYRGRCLFCYPLMTMRYTSSSSAAACYSATAQRDSSSRRGRATTADSPSSSALRLLLSDDILEVLTVMKCFLFDTLVQERGCERLWILSWDDENALAIGRVGGIRVLLNALQVFASNGHLQQCGCETLQNLAAVSDWNRREIADMGGIALVVQAMVRHSHHAGIQQSACSALSNLAAAKDLQGDIVRVGLSAILLAARNFAEHASVVAAATEAVTALGFLVKGSRLPCLVAM